MTYTVEVEQDGRISIPDDLRGSMHLEPGVRLRIEPEPDFHTLTLRVDGAPAQERIFEDRGVLVYRSLGDQASEGADIVREIVDMREERMRHVMGWPAKTDDVQ
jgi:hypothetical protein